MRLLLIAAVTGAASVAVYADTKEVDNKSYWLCKSKGQVRTIRVHIDDQGVCTTFYSKAGAEKVVGSGRVPDSCMGFLNNIKTNLEKSNWSCRDITDTKITASVE